ncbi:MAG: hypothetical protein ACPGU1_13215 [Myxococcota bacterium]
MRYLTSLFVLAFVCVGCAGSPSSDLGTPSEVSANESSQEDPGVASTETSVEESAQDTAPTRASEPPTEPSTPDDHVSPPGGGISPPPPSGEPVNPEICSGDLEGALQPFGGACCYTGDHDHNADCVWYSDAFQDSAGQCMDGQCATGSCLFGTYCSKNCTVYADEVRNDTLTPGVDGINDPTALEECAGAANGPMGAEYHCVNQANVTEASWGVCRPGTTFADCDSNVDCPNDEICAPLYVMGQVESRCMAREKQSADVGDACNSDPNAGPIQHCASGFCYGGACVSLCKDVSDCLTDVCLGGSCSKDPARTCGADADCSAFECIETAPFATNAYTHGLCMPKPCFAEDDCTDPDWFCRPFWNGADVVDEVAYAPACTLQPEETVGYGEACSVPGDDAGLPLCAWEQGCLANHCSAPCSAAEDCEAGSECLHALQWALDVDKNETLDTYLNVDACQVWPHVGVPTDCVSDADCPEGAHCQFRVVGSGEGEDRTWRGEYKCRADAEGQLSLGDVCDTSSAHLCASDLCLETPDQKGAGGLCSAYCTAASDCESAASGMKSVCTSMLMTGQNNLTPADDVYVAHCAPTSAESSLASCEATRHCVAPNEFCRAHAIAGNPDAPALVEYLCVDGQVGSSPAGAVGASCAEDADCLGRTCVLGASALGYCSELCLTDEDCQTSEGLSGLTCKPETLIERQDAAMSAITARCLL